MPVTTASDMMEAANVRRENRGTKDCQFTIIIERQPEGKYLVSVPALPGCYTEGSTLEEAREMAADAIRAHCASVLGHGEPILCESIGIEGNVDDLSESEFSAGEDLRILEEAEACAEPGEGGARRSGRAQNPLARTTASWRWIEPYLLPLLVTLLALSLYLYRLDSQSFWYDELANLGLSGWERSWLDAISGPLREPGTSKPPLSFLIAYLSMMLGEQTFVLRLPPALFATLTIPVVYALGRVLFAGQALFPGRCWTRSPQVGLLAALLLALAPLQIRYAQEFRMYAMWVFLSVLSLYLFWRAIRSETGHWWIAFSLVSVLALYTHTFAMLYLAVLALFGLWLLARPSTRDQFPFRAWHLIAALVATLLAYAPMMLFLPKGLTSWEGLVAEPASNWDLAFSLSALRLFSGGYNMGALVCAGLLLVAVIVLAVRGRAVLLLATLWIVLPVSVVVILPFGHELYIRYFLCALPVYLLLVAYGLLAASEWLGSRLVGRDGVTGERPGRLRRAVILLTAATLTGMLVAINAASISRYYAETKQSWRDATRLLCSLAEPGERIYVRHMHYRTGVLYYARQGASDQYPLAAEDVQVLPRDLAQAFPPGGDEACWLIVPATPKFLPGGKVDVEIQPHYRFLQPALFLPSWVPTDMAIISPLTFQGVTVVRVVPNEQASIRFWTEEDEIDSGDCTLLHWEVDSVREVYLQGDGVVGHGQRQVCPRTTTCYELEVIHQDGTVSTHMAEIEVRGGE